MILSNEEIRKIADLARILVSDEDIPELQERLSRVLTMIEQMNTMDTEGVLPMSHPYEATQRLRLDDVTETNQRELFQQIAPDVGHGLYFVPLVIE
ncbi:MAG: Asp-tRNA(Asn)/Glu-tRNA(Gln) amidotransferase subunit GatC [Gammaproteobacteria bacterium]|nr:Asp-tRNA(Asn)/Glu-tRNA(Gln) amidotransferase subunit GatC [Gammaproteobacteria bacterium]